MQNVKIKYVIQVSGSNFIPLSFSFQKFFNSHLIISSIPKALILDEGDFDKTPQANIFVNGLKGYILHRN